MSIRIPIITDFDGKGLSRARAEFRQLDGALAKTKYAFSKALLPATAALGGLAAVAMSSVDAALKDQKAQVTLARSLRNTLGATEAQIAATEEWISLQGKTLGITDDELRPAFAKLTRSTKDTAKTQKLLGLAFDISRGTGADLQATVDSLAKAYNGNYKSLKALAPELGALIKDGATADQIFQKLGETFRDSAAEYAGTAAGRLEILKVRFSELFEELGYAFLPAFERLMPYFEDLAQWLEDNPDKIAAFATGVGNIAEAFVNVLRSLADFWRSWERIWNSIAVFTEGVLNGIIDGINGVIRGLNILNPFSDIQYVPLVDFAKTEKERQAEAAMFASFARQSSFITGPMTMPGGSNNAPGFIGPRLSDVNPALRTNMGTFGGFMRGAVNNITVNVNGGDPKAVVDAIVKWSRQNGKLPPQIQTAY